MSSGAEDRRTGRRQDAGLQHLRWASLSTPYTSIHLARIFYRSGQRCAVHDHDFAEVFWIEAGSIVQEGPAGDEALSGGSLVYLRPEDAHGFRCDGHAVMVNIAIAPGLFAAVQERYAGVVDHPWAPGRSRRTLQVEPGCLRALGERVDRFPDDGGDSLAADALVASLLLAPRRGARAEGADAASSWLGEALAALREPPLLAEGLPALLRLSGRSREHVARTCRAQLGQSPTALLVAARLRWVARELALRDASVEALVAACGSANRSHFYRLFQRQYGCTPGEYRQRCRAAAQAG